MDSEASPWLSWLDSCGLDYISGLNTILLTLIGELLSTVVGRG